MWRIDILFLVCNLATPVYASYAPQFQAYYAINPRVDLRSDDAVSAAAYTMDRVWGCFEHAGATHENRDTNVTNVIGIVSAEMMFSPRCRAQVANATIEHQRAIPLHQRARIPVTWLANIHAAYPDTDPDSGTRTKTGLDATRLWLAAGGSNEMWFDFTTAQVHLSVDKSKFTLASLLATAVYTMLATMCNATLAMTDHASSGSDLDIALARGFRMTSHAPNLVDLSRVATDFECLASGKVSTRNWNVSFAILTNGGKRSRKDRAISLVTGFMSLVVPLVYNPERTSIDIRTEALHSVFDSQHAFVANFTGLDPAVLASCARDYAWREFPFAASGPFSAFVVTIPAKFAGMDIVSYDTIADAPCRVLGREIRVSLLVTARFAEQWRKIATPDANVPVLLNRVQRRFVGLVCGLYLDPDDTDASLVHIRAPTSDDDDDDDDDNHTSTMTIQFAKSVHGNFSVYTPANITEQRRSDGSGGAIQMPFAYVFDAVKRDDSSTFRVVYTPEYMANVTAGLDTMSFISPYDAAWLDPVLQLVRRRMPYMYTFSYCGDADADADAATNNIFVLLQAKQTFYESLWYQSLTMFQELFNDDRRIIPERIGSLAMRFPSIVAALFMSTTATTSSPSESDNNDNNDNNDDNASNDGH